MSCPRRNERDADGRDHQVPPALAGIPILLLASIRTRCGEMAAEVEVVQ